MTLRLLSYNIRFGGRGREAQLAAAIRQVAPDLVVFQEAIDPRVIEAIAEATSSPFWAARPAHSIGYVSRIEIAHHEWHYPPGAKHSFLEIVPAGRAARIFGLHLSAIFSKWSERRRAREIRALLQGISQHQEGFHLLAGDFNALAPGEVLDTRRMPHWIRALVWLSGRDIARETIQVMLDAGYLDCFRLLHPAAQRYSFPTWDAHLRLDYFFVPARYRERVKTCEIIDEPATVAAASDHFPVLAEVEID
ncbi:MAG TPA: endonuclease/exonuclease/phosphatase family protein [Blastocatellia bacterium]